MKASDIEKSPLRTMFWRDEILQVMYWMDGENFGNWIPAKQMLTLLNTNSHNLLYHLTKLTAEGYLEFEGEPLEETSLICLSEMGKKEAGGRFSEAFQGLQKAGHGECGPDCEFCYGTDGVKLDNCVHNCDHH
jgi:hypothetical protein